MLVLLKSSSEEKCPVRDSNPNHRFRRPVLYPVELTGPHFRSGLISLILAFILLRRWPKISCREMGKGWRTTLIKESVYLGLLFAGLPAGRKRLRMDGDKGACSEAFTKAFFHLVGNIMYAYKRGIVCHIYM